jgi:hypothetical protein
MPIGSGLGGGNSSQIAEDAGRHGRQRRRQHDPAFGDQGPQGRKRRRVARLEPPVPIARGTVDLGTAFDGAPDQVGVETDDGIASAYGAALDRFQEKAHGPAGRDLEKSRHRSLQVGDQRGPHDLRLAARIALRKCARLRLDLHSHKLRN